MKYEAVFGDYKFSNPAGEIAMQSSFGEIIEMRLTKPLVIPEGWGLIAMRRVIPEPKRWTVEDKKAGRLPEVGSIVVSTGFNEKCEFLGVGMVNGFFVVRLPNGLISINSASSFNPIETPEEKAQREEDEFINSLISVDIPVGGFFSQGARAAYRKLKGGE